MYTVTSNQDEQSFPTRVAAIEAAKEISGEVRGDVIIEDDLGTERFVYERGELASYMYEMPHRRRGRA